MGYFGFEPLHENNNKDKQRHYKAQKALKQLEFYSPFTSKQLAVIQQALDTEGFKVKHETSIYNKTGQRITFSIEIEKIIE